MNIIDQTIQNLEFISKRLERAAVGCGNDDWSYYLEHNSYNLFKEAQWLKSKREFIEGFCGEDDRRSE
jgi:hypothetical protein